MLNVGLPNNAKIKDVWGSLKGRKEVVLDKKRIAIIHRIDGQLVELRSKHYDKNGNEIPIVGKRLGEFIGGKWQIDKDVRSGTNRLFEDEISAAIAAIIER